jgi:hypothetical protein
VNDTNEYLPEEEEPTANNAKSNETEHKQEIKDNDSQACLTEKKEKKKENSSDDPDYSWDHPNKESPSFKQKPIPIDEIPLLFRKKLGSAL